MYTSHRQAFPLAKNQKTPIEANLDNIINLSQVKLKEMVLQKQEIDKELNLLIGQENVLSNSIWYHQKSIKTKKKGIYQLKQWYKSIQEEIKESEMNLHAKIKEANDSEAMFKQGINSINNELDSIQSGTIAEKSLKNQEIRTSLEQVVALKEENILLRERLLKLNRELHTLEYEIGNSTNDDSLNSVKAKKGIDMINQIFDHQMKSSNLGNTQSLEYIQAKSKKENKEIKNEENSEKKTSKEKDDEEEEPKTEKEVKPMEPHSHSVSISEREDEKPDENLEEESKHTAELAKSSDKKEDIDGEDS